MRLQDAEDEIAALDMMASANMMSIGIVRDIASADMMSISMNSAALS